MHPNEFHGRMKARFQFMAMLVALLASMQIAFANLGETSEQIQARYGKPTKGPIDHGNGVVRYSYQLPDRVVQVEFLNGKSSLEAFQPNKGQPNYTDAQCMAIAVFVSGTTNWTVLGNDGEQTDWISDDYSASIWRRAGRQHYLLVRTSAWLAHELLHPVDDTRLLKSLSTNKTMLQGALPRSSKETREQTDARVLKWQQELAEKGDRYGEYRMGLRYRDGEGVPQDVEKARSLLEKAADQGNADAAAALAKLPRPPRKEIDFSEFTIQSADFGRNDNVVDVKEKVVELLSTESGFNVDGKTLGVDPVPGKKKHLKIAYEYKGIECELNISAGKRLTRELLLKQALK